jgi:hypothetical protein
MGPGSFWRRARVLIVGLVLARGVMYLCVLPPFEGWDEYQHVGYVEHVVETGRAAVLGEANVPRPLLEAAVALPHPEGVSRSQLKEAGAVDYAAFWQRPDRPPTFRPSSPPIGLYQAQHASLYYRLAAPVFSRFGGVKDLRASVAALRFVNVVLTAAAVAVVLSALRRAMSSERGAALAGLALASHPLFLLNGARVANDALGVFLAAVAVAVGFRLGDEDRRLSVPLKALVLGTSAGLAALAKATNYALLPFLGLALLAAAVRLRLAPRRVALASLLVAAGFLAVTQAELRFNLAHFGSPTSMQEAVINGRQGRTTADLIRTASAVDWGKLTRRLWVRDVFFAGGWSVLRTHPEITRLYQLAVTIGLAGWGWIAASAAWRRLRHGGGDRAGGSALFSTAWVPLGCLVLVLSYTAALGYHRVHSALAWGAATTNPWYACPALPWFLALAVAGGLAWTRHSRAALLRAAWPLLMAGAGLAAEPVAVWGMMVPTYSGGASGFEALSRLASLQPAALGTATFFTAIAAEVVVVVALVRLWSGTGTSVRANAPALRGPHLWATRESQDQPLGRSRGSGYGAG